MRPELPVEKGDSTVRIAVTIALALLASAAPTAATQSSETSEYGGVRTLFSEDFEGGSGGWQISDGVWEIGTPTSGPGEAHSGQFLAATVLDGDYPRYVGSRLISPEIELEEIGATEELVLRFWQHFHWTPWGDYGQVQVRVYDDGGGTWSDWSTLSTLTMHTPVWHRARADLSTYAGERVQVAFYHQDVDEGYYHSEGPGWYVDDVEIIRQERPVLSGLDDFESGWGGWYSDRGIWELGEPTTGPGAAHSGTSCMATVLDGNYPYKPYSRLVSPLLVVPPASENPSLRFWHWYDFAPSDFGRVDIRVLGGGWETAIGPFSGPGDGGWHRPFYDLTPLAGQTVQVSFFHQDMDEGYYHSEGPGWYVDDFEVVTYEEPPPPEIVIRKTATAVVPGRNVDYFILLENVGDAAADSLEVAEILNPRHMTLLTVDPPGVAPDSLLSAASFAYWIVPEIPPGSVATLSYTVRLRESVPLGTMVYGPTCAGDEMISRFEECVNQLAMTAAGCALCVPVCSVCAALCSTPEIIVTIPPCLTCLVPCVDCLLCGSTTGCQGGCLQDVASVVDCFWDYYDDCVFTEDPAVGPVDPNEKLVIADRYIRPGDLLVYPIHFENIGEIEARDVFVTDVLDSNLVMSSVEILTPEGGSFDPETRTVRWELLGVDLAPGESDNVLVSARALPDLPTGTIIRNDADIQFEIFDVFTTNQVVNIVDLTPPAGEMVALPDTVSSVEFPIEWTGMDEVGEIDVYSIFVSVDGGPYVEHIAATADTQATFEGADEHHYGFQCIATDKAGNIEALGDMAEAETYVSTSYTSGQPTLYALMPATPNPFGRRATIRFDLPAPGRVDLRVYSAAGREVAVLVDGPRSIGRHTETWEPGDAASGVYFIRLRVDDFSATRKVVLTR
jgi:uncharacterized repeat protein (TIGR01451 family)